ncbi:MAG: DUF3817 domain-containing protein [Myxococcota bacterium]
MVDEQKPTTVGAAPAEGGSAAGRSAVAWLRTVGIVEGISWLVLLFIAMPLKYGFGQPAAVRIVGTAHGGLFVLFVVLLGVAHIVRRWTIVRSFGLFLSALFPFGFLFVERSLKTELSAE